MPLPRRRVAHLALVALVLTGLSACGGSGTGSGGGASKQGCGRPVTEELDRRSLVHVLPGAPEPEYLTDPPTSGPHQPSPAVSGYRSTALTRPVQVGILESGGVLLQYRPGLAMDQLAGLRKLAVGRVVVAPNSAVEPGQAVVGTAWLNRITCTSIDPAALSAFVDAHAGKIPTGH